MIKKLLWLYILYKNHIQSFHLVTFCFTEQEIKRNTILVYLLGFIEEG